jgi:hypothetical protein
MVKVYNLEANICNFVRVNFCAQLKGLRRGGGRNFLGKDIIRGGGRGNGE